MIDGIYRVQEEGGEEVVKGESRVEARTPHMQGAEATERRFLMILFDHLVMDLDADEV